MRFIIGKNRDFHVLIHYNDGTTKSSYGKCIIDLFDACELVIKNSFGIIRVPKSLIRDLNCYPSDYFEISGPFIASLDRIDSAKSKYEVDVVI